MRIIAGCAKKKLLKVYPGWKGRPTADRVKEALFSILGDLVPDAVFLDLFAGTGSIGIEALSRGAQSAIFIEKDPRAVRSIIHNLKAAKLDDNARILGMDIFKALPRLPKGAFDIIFLDPPYAQGYELPVIKKIIELDLPSQEGVIIAESSKREELPDNILGYTLYKLQKYGDTKLSFFKK